ncbi:MAG: hypothetical protein MUF68_03765 [Cyclobacteriaceae bacterium]|nr:hypothetical protein [Cyclobacteriaceae bacterium]
MVGKLAFFIAIILLTSINKPNTILFFGDSLTAGYGLSAEEAFPALLQKELRK